MRVRVIAGEALGASAVIDTRTPIMLLHFIVQPGGEVVQPVPPAHNAMAYVFAGEAVLGPEGAPVRSGQLAVYGAGTGARLGVGAEAGGPAELLLLTGVPLREPVARYGPFVMNTREEIVQAFHDFQSGRFGRMAVSA